MIHSIRETQTHPGVGRSRGESEREGDSIENRLDSTIPTYLAGDANDREERRKGREGNPCSSWKQSGTYCKLLRGALVLVHVVLGEFVSRFEPKPAIPAGTGQPERDTR